jgi:Ca-activated chloride channel family protein
MSFVYEKYFLLSLIFIFIFIFFITREHKSYFQWVKTHWGLSVNLKTKLAVFCYYIPFILLFIALLDLRGPEEKVTEKMPRQKTLILIDVSSSMLVEDVRPNRINKALLMARHFTKSAFGHEIGVMIFSDISKKLIPFTTDYDLLDNRLSGLEEIDLDRGGSNISLAIESAVAEFTTEGSQESGNILIFSDSEESVEAYDLKVPDSVSVAFVGIGTITGGKIPLRNKQNSFIGFKRYQGEEVTSSLNENFLKNLGARIKNYQYWVAQSFSLPTDEVLSFFNKTFKKRFDESQIRVKTVYGHYLILLALLLWTISFLLKLGKNFEMAKNIVLVALLFSSYNGDAQQLQDPQEPEIILTPEETREVVEWENRLKKANLGPSGKMRLASLHLKSGKIEKALQLYNENYSWVKNDIESLINYGTTLALNKLLPEAIVHYRLAFILDKSSNSEYEEVIRKNTAWVLQNKMEQDQEQKKQDQQKQQDEKQEQQNKDGDAQEEEGSSGKQENEQKGDASGKQQENNQVQKNENENENKQGEKKEKDKNNDDENKNSKKEGNNNDNKENKEQKKMSALMKQLIQKEKHIQKVMLDTTTNDEQKYKEKKKDW